MIGAKRGRTGRRYGQGKPDKAIGAHLEQHARKDDRARGRGFYVGVGQPGMEREHGHLDGEGGGEGQEDPVLQVVGHAGPLALQVEYVQGLGLELRYSGDDGHQHQERAGQGVEEELDGCVDSVGRAPDADQEGHGHEHYFPEDVEDEEVERDEHAHHTCLEEEKHDIELAYPGLVWGPRKPGWR